jgi:hypothetical protein
MRVACRYDRRRRQWAVRNAGERAVLFHTPTIALTDVFLSRTANRASFEGTLRTGFEEELELLKKRLQLLWTPEAHYHVIAGESIGCNRVGFLWAHAEDKVFVRLLNPRLPSRQRMRKEFDTPTMSFNRETRSFVRGQQQPPVTRPHNRPRAGWNSMPIEETFNSQSRRRRRVSIRRPARPPDRVTLEGAQAAVIDWGTATPAVISGNSYLTQADFENFERQAAQAVGEVALQLPPGAVVPNVHDELMIREMPENAQIVVQSDPHTPRNIGQRFFRRDADGEWQEHST